MKMTITNGSQFSAIRIAHNGAFYDFAVGEVTEVPDDAVEHILTASRVTASTANAEGLITDYPTVGEYVEEVAAPVAPVAPVAPPPTAPPVADSHDTK